MNIYDKYALLEAKLTELEVEKAELRTKILETMVKDGEERVETAMGNFKKSMLKTWTYTDKYNSLKEDCKELKAHEESTGDATFVEKPSLKYIAIKL